VKLYYQRGTCSLHPHIALLEAGLPFELVRVDTRTHKLAGGGDYYAVNSKGYVPALELDDGSVLTEGAVIDQYVADQRPGSGLLPPAGTMARYRVLEWQNFIATELHKAFGPLFGGSDEARARATARIRKWFDWTAKEVGGRPFLTGETFTVADGYLYNVLRWAGPAGIDLASWPSLLAFHGRVDRRPTVQAALAAEK
jgi:glutathione S-transferase